MKNERFTLTSGKNMKWTVKDNETGFSVEFTEGMFNETQKVSKPDSIPADCNDVAIWVAKAMTAIADYMAQEHPFIALCNPDARRRAVWALPNDNYWIAMADAMNGIDTIGCDGISYAVALNAEMEDYFDLNGGAYASQLSEAERTNLLGSLSMLEEDEAIETFRMICAFWQEHYDAETSVTDWANEILWWPAWVNNIIDNEN